MRQVYRALLVLAFFSTSCATDRPAKVCAAEVRPLPAAWEAPAHSDLWPKPKKLETLQGASWGGDTKTVVYCVRPEWRVPLQKAFPKLTFSLDPESANVRVQLDSTLQEKPEGAYRLEMRENSATLAGRDLAGAAYALHTFQQLLRLKRFEPVKIEDWPTLPIRGLMLHTGPQSGATHRRLLEQAMGPLKMNMLLLECEYTQWESCPELWDQNVSIKKSELKKTVDAARRNLVEPVPLIQTLTHMGWLYVNGQNKELGASSNFYSFPPHDKATWTKILRIYEEAIELFQPKRFHIGFDEVRGLRGLFPGSEKTTEQVVAEEAEVLRKWLLERNLQTLMWADPLIHRSETGEIGFARSPETARFLRENLSKEILLMDWQYEVKPPRFPEVKVLAEAGFQVMAATWNDPATTVGHAASVAEHKGPGVIHTTWPGRVLNDRVVEGSEFYQFAEMVTAAEAAWNGGANSEVESGPVFRRLWSGYDPPSQSSGKAVVFEGEKSENLESKKSRLGGVQFQTGQRILVNEPVQLTLGSTAAEIDLLLFARGEKKPGVAVANLEIHWDDGQMKQVPLRWQKEVEQLEGGVLMYRAPVAWQDGSRRLHRWGWVNPEPEKPIRRLVFVPVQEGAELVVEGVTLLDQAVSDDS